MFFLPPAPLCTQCTALPTLRSEVSWSPTFGISWLQNATVTVTVHERRQKGTHEEPEIKWPNSKTIGIYLKDDWLFYTTFIKLFSGDSNIEWKPAIRVLRRFVNLIWMLLAAPVYCLSDKSETLCNWYERREPLWIIAPAPSYFTISSFPVRAISELRTDRGWQETPLVWCQVDRRDWLGLLLPSCYGMRTGSIRIPQLCVLFCFDCKCWFLVCFV